MHGPSASLVQVAACSGNDDPITNFRPGRVPDTAVESARAECRLLCLRTTSAILAPPSWAV